MAARYAGSGCSHDRKTTVIATVGARPWTTPSASHLCCCILQRPLFSLWLLSPACLLAVCWLVHCFSFLSVDWHKCLTSHLQEGHFSCVLRRTASQQSAARRSRNSATVQSLPAATCFPMALAARSLKATAARHERCVKHSKLVLSLLTVLRICHRLQTKPFRLLSELGCLGTRGDGTRYPAHAGPSPGSTASPRLTGP